MGSTFRPARRGDAARLAPLVEQLGYASTAEAVGARLARLLEADDQALIVAEEGEELLGWVHVQEFLSLASDPCALVTGLVVAATARRRGLGCALMLVAEDWARARGLSSMRLRARVARRGSHAFYGRLGFVLVKTQRQFQKEL